MHQGNLFVEADGTITAIDFGIMGRIDRRARQWLAEILYGLTTGNYRRVAEIHFEAQYVPSYHSVDEFATALRAVGEPMRGKPVSELSVGQMLDGLFAITRDFDMQTQPHLLLLQKTMVMVEGIATQLDPADQHVGHRALRARAGSATNWARKRRSPTGSSEDARDPAAPARLIRRLEENVPAQGRRARAARNTAPLPCCCW
jgi:ubiquinone biosynthesis protein